MDLDATLATAQTIDGWMTPAELEWLFQTARSLPRESCWVELGLWKGRSFFTVAMGLSRDSRLIGVDSFTPHVTALPFVPTRDWVSDHFHVVESNVKRLRADLRIEILRLDTALAGGPVRDASVDVVYFDADHDREGLARDFAAWIPKVKPSGLLCGHDYSGGLSGRGRSGRRGFSRAGGRPRDFDLARPQRVKRATVSAQSKSARDETRSGSGGSRGTFAYRRRATTNLGLVVATAAAQERHFGTAARRRPIPTRCRRYRRGRMRWAWSCRRLARDAGPRVASC